MSDFEDVRLCDLLNKVEKRTKEIFESKQISLFKDLGKDVQNVYDFVLTAKNTYEAQQPLLKNLFSSFNYAAVIINDAVKEKKLDDEAKELLLECLEIITACCKNIKTSLTA